MNNENSADSEPEGATSPLELRPPLPIANPQLNYEDHTPIIRPLLYRMFVATHVLRLGTEARFTALVLLHRYTMATKHEPKERLCESKWVAAACLFLACKAEEEPRRLRDVINLAYMILSPPSSSSSRSFEKSNNSDPKGEQMDSGDGPGPRDEACNKRFEILEIRDVPPNLNEEYWQAKKKIVETEQIVLRWLGFDVSVSHPHRAVRTLIGNETSETSDRLKLLAFRRLNDALFHAPAMMHNVWSMACAALSLAMEEDLEKQHSQGQCGQPDAETKDGLAVTSRFSKPHWWNAYHVSDKDFESAKEDLLRAIKVLETNGHDG